MKRLIVDRGLKRRGKERYELNSRMINIFLSFVDFEEVIGEAVRS